MVLSQTEFDALMTDASKRIEGDICWTEDEDHSPAVEFRFPVKNPMGFDLFVRGSFNPLIQALSFTLILRPVGRIYALDLGKDHHNPDCNRTGDKHKHRWDETHGVKVAYVPNDITAPVTDPVQVWQQFCSEAKIVHQGQMNSPPSVQGSLFI